MKLYRDDKFLSNHDYSLSFRYDPLIILSNNNYFFNNT